MFTQPITAIDAVTVETIGRALRTGDLRAEFPGPEDLALLEELSAPTLLVVGEHDPFFQAARTLRRAERYLPSIVDSVTLAGERYFLSPDAQEDATTAIRSFLNDHYDGVV